MATKTGKPQAGDLIRYDFVLLGEREATWDGTVVSWPAHDRVKVRVDDVLFDPKGSFARLRPDRIVEWDEHTAAMYVTNGTVKVVPAATSWRKQRVVAEIKLALGSVYGLRMHTPRDRWNDEQVELITRIEHDLVALRESLKAS